MGDAARRVVHVAAVALAAYRVWRIVGYDTVSEPARDRLRAAADGDPSDPRTTAAAWAADLVECPWCLGTWLAFAVGWAAHRHPDRTRPAIDALAAATVAGWVHHVIESRG